MTKDEIQQEIDGIRKMTPDEYAQEFQYNEAELMTSSRGNLVKQALNPLPMARFFAFK